jgi:hypothetical protein
MCRQTNWFELFLALRAFHFEIKKFLVKLHPSDLFNSFGFLEKLNLPLVDLV